MTEKVPRAKAYIETFIELQNCLNHNKEDYDSCSRFVSEIENAMRFPNNKICGEDGEINPEAMKILVFLNLCSPAFFEKVPDILKKKNFFKAQNVLYFFQLIIRTNT